MVTLCSSWNLYTDGKGSYAISDGEISPQTLLNYSQVKILKEECNIYIADWLRGLTVTNFHIYRSFCHS